MVTIALVRKIIELQRGSSWPVGCVSIAGRVPCCACGVADAKWCNHHTSEHTALCDQCLSEHAALFELDTLVNGTA